MLQYMDGEEYGKVSCYTIYEIGGMWKNTIDGEECGKISEYGKISCYNTWMGRNVGKYAMIHGMGGIWENIMLQYIGWE